MTKRQLNTKLLAVLFFGTVILAVGAFFAHRFMTKRSASGLLDRAKTAESKNELEEAFDYYDRYLKYVPTDLDTTASFGQLVDKYGLTFDQSKAARSMRGRAVALFEKVLLREPGRNDIRKALVSIIVDLAQSPNDFQLAVPHIEHLIKEAEGTKDVDKTELAHLKGQRGMIYVGEKNPREAARAFEESIKLDPKQIDFYFPYAQILREELNDPKKADEVMDLLVKENPNSLKGHLARAGYHVKYENIPAAEADVKILLEREPNDADVILAASAVELAKPNFGGDLNKARALLTEGMKRYPKRREMYLARADLELRTRNVEAAEAALAKGVEMIPDSDDMSWFLVNTYIEYGQRAEAQKVVDRLELAGFPAPLVNLLKARILVADAQWEAGLIGLKAVRPTLEPFGKLPKVQADLDMARCFHETGVIDDEITAYKRVLSVDPENPTAILSLSTAQFRNDPASAESLRTLQGANTLEANLLQAQLLARKVVALPANQRDWSPVTKQLDVVDRITPKLVATLLMRAEIDLAQNRPDQAIARVKAARDAEPKRPELWAALAQINLQAGKPNDSLALIEEADRTFGPKPELFLARVQVWSRRKDAAARQALLNMVPRIADMPADRQDTFAALLAQYLSDMGANTEALALMQSAVKKLPNSLRAQAALFEIAYRAGDDTLMRQTIEAMRRLEGDAGTQWRYGEAAQIVSQARRENDTSRLAEAKRRLEEVRRARGTWARVPRLESEIAKLQGDNAATIEALNKAIQLGERDVSVIRELVRLYYEEKRYAEADQAIRTIQERGGQLENELKRMASEVSIQMRDEQQALRMAREAVSVDSTDFRDHVWLGQIYIAVGDPKEAEKAFEKAVSLAPDKPESWLAYVAFLIRYQRRADAEALLERASKALPADIAALTLAKGYKVVGRNDLAEALFEKALAAKPNDLVTVRTAAAYFLDQGRLDRAEPLLKARMGANASASDRFWARRYLALAIFESDITNRLPEALALIEANLKEDPKSVDDQHALAFVLTAFPERRAEAVKLFEDLELDFKTKLPPGDRLVMAQLYESQGDWSKARLMFQELVASYPDNTKILMAYLRVLVKRNEFNEANQWLQRLKDLKYSSAQLLAIQASLLNAQKQTPQAIELVREFAKQNPEQSRAAADMLERLGETTEAESMLKKLAEQKDHPENALALAAFYGRQNRPQEAVDLCDSARKAKVPLDKVLAAAFSALGVSQPSPELLQRIETWIDEAEHAEGQKQSFENQRGLLWTLAGRYKDAEALYRKAIAVNSADVMALNNLAWLLALTGGDADEALALIDRAIGVIGYNSSLLDTRGVIHIARKRPDLAVTDLKRALKDRKDASLHFHLARAQFAANDRKSAAESMQTALSLGLKAADVDPLERSLFNTLVDELKKQ